MDKEELVERILEIEYKTNSYANVLMYVLITIFILIVIYLIIGSCFAFLNEKKISKSLSKDDLLLIKEFNFSQKFSIFYYFKNRGKKNE